MNMPIRPVKRPNRGTARTEINSLLSTPRPTAPFPESPCSSPPEPTTVVVATGTIWILTLRVIVCLSVLDITVNRWRTYGDNYALFSVGGGCCIAESLGDYHERIARSCCVGVCGGDCLSANCLFQNQLCTYSAHPLPQ